MNVRKEIELYSSEADKPILNWLFEQYHLESQWQFVAKCTFKRYGTNSYEVHRVWSPTKEGRILAAYLEIDNG